MAYQTMVGREFEMGAAISDIFDVFAECRPWKLSFYIEIDRNQWWN